MGVLREEFRRWKKADLMARLETIGLPFAPVSKPEDLFDDPHLNAAGGLVDITLPNGQATRLPALPIEMDGRRFGLRSGLPGVGQHNRERLLSGGLSPAEVDELVAAGVLAA